MSWYSVPRVTAPTYHSYGLQRRPWAVVRDADGFSAEAINGYLQYAAWQDAPPGRVRSDARGLAAAAAWLETIGRPWATADLDIWATYCEDLMYERWDLSPQRAYHVVETLHRVYAFWHWQDPHAVPWQPFPATHPARVAWVQSILTRTDREPYR